nr:low molecular weight protein-tyrosine-phosphatase [Rubrobacter marinus]
MVRVLFVCLGNICRSPISQGVFEEVVRREGLSGEIEADSAGTHGFYHAGEPPDPRAQRSAMERGIDLSGQRARLLSREDCERFDYVLTMDEENYERVAALCRSGEGGAVIRPFLDFAPTVRSARSPTLSTAAPTASSWSWTWPRRPRRGSWRTSEGGTPYPALAEEALAGG